MALNWDGSKTVRSGTPDEIQAWNDRFDYDEELANFTLFDTLLWRSLVLGWGWELTAAKLDKVIERNHVYERVYDGVHIPPRFLADMVGLSTNVSELTDAAFYKHIREELTRNGKAAAARYRRSLETPTAP